MVRWFGTIFWQVALSALAFATTNCPMCQKAIVPSRAVYAVILVGESEHRLTVRCIQCAFHAVKRWNPDRALLRTRCAATKRWVTLEWTKGQWRADPTTVRLLLAPEVGGECLHRHLVFVNSTVAQKFLVHNPELRSFPLLSVNQLSSAGGERK